MGKNPPLHSAAGIRSLKPCLNLHNPMTALARKLQSRGNEIVFITVPDAEPVLRAANLNFVTFCEEEYPAGSIARAWSSVAKLHGEEVLRHSTLELTPGLCGA